MSEQQRPASKYAHLPPPIRLEDTVASDQGLAYPPDRDDYWREVEWMLRVSGIG